MIFRSSRSDDFSEGGYVFALTKDKGYCNIPTGGRSLVEVKPLFNRSGKPLKFEQSCYVAVILSMKG